MLTQKQIKVITNKIVDGYHPEKVYLFGSYTKGTANDNSDLDLMIIKQTDEPFHLRAREVRMIFSTQPAAFDIIVYTPIEFEDRKNKINQIAYFVNKEGVLIYER